MVPEAVPFFMDPVAMVPKNGTFVNNLKKRIDKLKKETTELQSDYDQLQEVYTFFKKLFIYSLKYLHTFKFCKTDV